MLLEFYIPCIPPKTTHQSKRLGFANGHPVMFKDRKAITAEQTLHALLHPHRPATPLQGCIRMRLMYVQPWRKTEKKSVKEKGIAYMPVKPDFDNLSKMICDTCTTQQFWEDDAQIVDCRVQKFRGDNPGLYFIIEEVEETPNFLPYDHEVKIIKHSDLSDPSNPSGH